MLSPKTAATADLQSPVRLTVAQAAKLMHVSPRMVYMARAVSRRRPDLANAVAAGVIKLSAAYAVVTGKGKRACPDNLRRAWTAATEAERAAFLAELHLGAQS